MSQWIEMEGETFYCPVTGIQIYSPEMEEYGNSPAIEFLYNDVAGEFVIASDRVRNILESCEEEMEMFFGEESVDFVLRKLNDPALAVFEMSCSGVGCGGAGMIDWLCINMNHGVED
ncbi:MAG: hypothetical protein JJU29_23580 [Verrucomicrobia bacterium]|nr:hypothetical protein [Verrucomicrobiota bacterium]MCH8510344.1 hypothetical protein [Kiritimatiellia bacterium]